LIGLTDIWSRIWLIGLTLGLIELPIKSVDCWQHWCLPVYTYLSILTCVYLPVNTYCLCLCLYLPVCAYLSIPTYLCLSIYTYLPVPTYLCLLSMPTVYTYRLCLSVPTCLCLPVYTYYLCLPVCNLGERSA
jgi:hypothetical protein